MVSCTINARALGLALFFAAAVPAQAQQPFTPAAEPPLQAAAQAIVGADDGWSVMAWSLDREAPLFAINANEIQIPASNNKVFTSIWALDVLGPDHRFPTDLLITAPIGDDGTLRGDVVLRGSGDPAFGYPEFTRDPMEPLRKMARQLKARGLRTVQGSVVGDGSAFDTLLVGPEWPRDTGGGSSAYAPRVSGLAFSRNLLWVGLDPTRPGQPAAVRLSPRVQEIPVVSTAKTGNGRAWAVRREDDDTIHVRGAVSGRGNRYGVGVSDPALLAAGALRQALIDEGIAVPQPARSSVEPVGGTLVHRHWSIPLGHMIAKLNQDSDNFFAEHLWKAAAAEAVGHGSYTRGGPASALFFIRKAGVPHGQVYQADGSGLSSHNRASAYALIQALIYADKAPWSELFHESLAVAASRQGTMNRLFRNTAAANNLHAKTGYIRGVRTLSGYVRTRNGENVAFSFLYNGRNTNGARRVQEDLGVLLADYAGATPASPASTTP